MNHFATKFKSLDYKQSVDLLCFKILIVQTPTKIQLTFFDNQIFFSIFILFSRPNYD
jgi:hypothetical protein